jgi:hypothetical protein
MHLPNTLKILETASKCIFWLTFGSLGLSVVIQIFEKSKRFHRFFRKASILLAFACALLYFIENVLQEKINSIKDLRTEKIEKDVKDHEKDISTLDQRTKPRIIPSGIARQLTERLKVYPDASVLISIASGETETENIASQIKEIFEASGWKTHMETLANRPTNGIIILIKGNAYEMPAKDIVSVFGSLGFKWAIEPNVKQDNAKFRIIVGKK